MEIRIRQSTLTLLPLLTISMLAAPAMATETKTTSGAQVKWFSDSLAKHLTIKTRDSQTLRLSSDGFYLKQGESQKSFLLKPGDKLQSSADHHASMILTFIGIDNKAAKFHYESRFDHRSFGKDLITIDSREVALPLPNRSA